MDRHSVQSGDYTEFSSEAAAATNLKVQIQLLTRQRDQARQDAKLWQERAAVAMEESQTTQQVLTHQLDEALLHVGSMQKHINTLQKERDELKSHLLVAEGQHHQRELALTNSIENLQAELDQANWNTQRLQMELDDWLGGRKRRHPIVAGQEHDTESDLREQLQDTERALRQVKARLHEVEEERNDAHRELNQVMSSYLARRQQLHDLLEDEKRKCQNLHERNEQLQIEVELARDRNSLDYETFNDVNIREVEELRDRLTLLAEECDTLRDGWQTAITEQQSTSALLSSTLKEMAVVKNERDVLLAKLTELGSAGDKTYARPDLDHRHRHRSSPDFHDATDSPNRYSAYINESVDDLLAGFRRRRHSIQRARGSGESSPYEQGTRDDLGSSDLRRSDREIARRSGSARASMRAKKKKEQRQDFREQSSSCDQEREQNDGQIALRPSHHLRPEAYHFISAQRKLMTPRPSLDYGSLHESLNNGSRSNRSSRLSEDIPEACSSPLTDSGKEGSERDVDKADKADILSPAAQKKLKESLAETRQLRDDYDQLKLDCLQAVKQLRDLRLKITGKSSPEPEKIEDLTEVRLPARTELGFVVETHMIVSKIVEGKAADKNGGLHPGDHIMQINGISMVDKTHSAAITALALAKDGLLKLTVLKAGSVFVGSLQASQAKQEASMFDLTPVRTRSERKSKRWRLRRQMQAAENPDGSSLTNGQQAEGNEAHQMSLNRSNSDRQPHPVMSIRERIKMRPRRKSTVGLGDDHQAEEVTVMSGVKQAKSTPNLANIGSDTPPRSVDDSALVLKKGNSKLHLSFRTDQVEQEANMHSEGFDPKACSLSEDTWLRAHEGVNTVSMPQSGRASAELLDELDQDADMENEREVVVQPPPPGSEEAAKGPGLRLKGGSLVGVYVAQVRPTGPAGGKNGLRKYDRILAINNKDMRLASLEEAHNAFRPDKHGQIRLYVVQSRIGYETMAVPYDSFYVRCLFEYEPRNYGELSFSAGDILYVTETVPQRYQQSWLAFYVGHESVSLLIGRDKIMGAVPNERRARKYIHGTSGRCHESGNVNGLPYRRLDEDSVVELFQVALAGPQQDDSEDFSPEWNASVHSEPSIHVLPSTGHADLGESHIYDVPPPPPPPPDTPVLPVRTSSHKATDDMLPWPMSIHLQLCEGLEDETNSWLMLLHQMEQRGALFTRRRSLRRKSRNCADSIIRRLYGEKDVPTANQLLLDSLSVMKRTDLLELLLDYVGMPPSKAPMPQTRKQHWRIAKQPSEDDCAL